MSTIRWQHDFIATDDCTLNDCSTAHFDPISNNRMEYLRTIFDNYLIADDACFDTRTRAYLRTTKCRTLFDNGAWMNLCQRVNINLFWLRSECRRDKDSSK